MVAGEPVVAQSQETTRRLIADGVRDAVHIPHGVDTTTHEVAEPALVRARLGIPEGPPLVLYAGDYRHRYAARTVAAALPRVLREVDAHFVLTCRVLDDRDRAEEARIRDAIAADGLSRHVTFLNIVDDLRSLMAIASVQIFPSDSANERMDLPRVLLEGMAEGLATIVAAKPPFEELVGPGGAIGVPTQQPLGFAAAIVELLRDDRRRRRLGEAGQRLVRARFDILAVAAEYEALYDRVLRRDAPAARDAGARATLRRTGARILRLRPRGGG
jgi:glycosyltransferase involved in cell wall biosynthesis